jgi:hypothetical protein
MKSRFGRTIRQGLAFLQAERLALAGPSCAIFFCAFARKKRTLLFGLSALLGLRIVSFSVIGV